MTMERIFLKALAGNRRKILFLMTADHGQVETDPQTSIYINRDPAFAGVEKLLKTNRQGELIVRPVRHAIFPVHPGWDAGRSPSFSRLRLEGRAEVWKVAEMIEAGYFGPVISPQFLGRVGDLVILPYCGESVWWYEKDKFEQRFYGHHGGLTRKKWKSR